ncbi:MAG: hypothetical protein Q7L07_05885 [Pseudohongiella sp.]|nr:hypothetical protein [Pseudohongiella sp.]
MRLLNHPLFKHPALALFLVFCLPVQALAAVLLECERHESNHTVAQQASVLSVTAQQEAAPDCHGSADNVKEIPDSDAGKMTNADANGCFHCSGVCQNLKSPGLVSTAQQSHFLDSSAFSRLTINTEVGISDTPVRPPCPMIPS